MGHPVYVSLRMVPTVSIHGQDSIEADVLPSLNKVLGFTRGHEAIGL